MVFVDLSANITEPLSEKDGRLELRTFRTRLAKLMMMLFKIYTLTRQGHMCAKNTFQDGRNCIVRKCAEIFHNLHLHLDI